MPRAAAVVSAGLAAMVVLAGCGSGSEEPAPEESPSAESSPAASSTVRTLPGGGESGVQNRTPEPSSSTAQQHSPEPTSSTWDMPSPGPNDVAGNGVIAPSPSPAVDGDGRPFPGFVDQSTVDRSSAEEVAIEAMRGLAVWDTTQDTVPGDAAGRVESLVTDEALEAGAGGPGTWSPMWWRQAQAAGAWSSADTEVVPLAAEVPAREGMELFTIEVEWSWHAPESQVVPEGGTRSCTATVEEVGGQQTVTGYDCIDQDELAGAEQDAEEP